MAGAAKGFASGMLLAPSSATMMKITPIPGSDGVRRLRVEGRITLEDARELSAACATGAGHPDLVLDLAGRSEERRVGKECRL